MIVSCYRNLHKKCYSVMYKGRVIKHLTNFCLKNAKFVVRESGRQRVIREKRKNVHAFVVGELVEDATGVTVGNRISYNPYEQNYFFDARTKAKLDVWCDVIFT